MVIYTVYEPDDAPDAVTRADRTTFVPERFSFWGLVFGWFFLLWHRAWLAAAIWLAVALLLGVVAQILPLHGGAVIALSVLMHLFVGLEGNDLRRWALERRGFRLAEVVAGAAREDAEHLFFSRHPLRKPAARPPEARPSYPNGLPAVIGFSGDGAS